MCSKVTVKVWGITSMWTIWHYITFRRNKCPIIIPLQSYLLLSVFHHPSSSLFHSRLKTFLFCKSFPLQPFFFFCRTDYMIPQTFTVTSSTAVFKLGSADQRGSATGFHGVRERIPKSSNCTVFNKQSLSHCFSALRGSVAVVWHDRLSVDVS